MSKTAKLNTRLLTQSAFFLSILLITGCAGRFDFGHFRANTAQDALQELIERREAIRDFQGTAIIRMKLEKMEMRLKSRIDYDIDEGWHVEITGPLGLKAAVIDVDDEEYTVQFPHIGRTEKARIDERFEIPGFNLSLPEVSFLTKPFLPVLDIKKGDGWRVKSADIKNKGQLVLVRESAGDAETMMIELDFNPLKPYREDRFLNGELFFTRRFIYKNWGSFLPSRFEITKDDLVLIINYKSLAVNQHSHISKDSREPL